MMNYTNIKKWFLSDKERENVEDYIDFDVLKMVVWDCMLAEDGSKQGASFSSDEKAEDYFRKKYQFLPHKNLDHSRRLHSVARMMKPWVDKMQYDAATKALHIHHLYSGMKIGYIEFVPNGLCLHFHGVDRRYCADSNFTFIKNLIGDATGFTMYNDPPSKYL